VINRWVTKDELALHLGVSESTIDRLVDKGMPSIKLNEARSGARRFWLDDVDEWVRENGKDAD
jgi:excisionase family DNA binding protein